MSGISKNRTFGDISRRAVIAAMVAAPFSGAFLSRAFAQAGGSNQTAWNPATDANFDPNGIVRFAANNDIVSWDVHRTGSSREQEFIFPVFDRLCHEMPNGMFRPGLAESWEFAPDGMSIVLKLRQGIKFHDGAEFNADAVKANLDRGKTLPASTVKGELSDVESVDVLNAHEVRINLVKRNYLITSQLSQRAGAMMSPKSFDDPDIGTKPVGTGMFKLTEYVRGSHAKYERFAEYWNPDVVKAAGLEFRILLDETARTNALVAGAVDLAFISAASIDSVKASGFTVDTQPTTELVWLLINLSKPPYDNLNVRKAIMHALNRNDLIEIADFGYGSPTFQVAAPSNPEYLPELENSYPHDIDKAKQLIADSGVTNLTIDAITFQGSEWHLRLGQAVQAQLAAAGITMNITPVDRAKAPELLFAQRSVHGMAGATVAGYPKALQLLEVIAYSKGRNNPAGFAVPGMDEAIGKAFEATTEEDYLKWAKEANRIATAEVATIPLWYSQAPCGISAKVAGFTKAAQARNEFYNVGVTA